MKKRNYYPEFAYLLNQYLEAEERPQAWLARRLGVGPRTVGRWVNDGKRPGSPEMVIRIAQVLRINEEEELVQLFKTTRYPFLVGIKAPPISEREPEGVSPPQKPVSITWGALFATFYYTDGRTGTAHDKAQRLVEHFVASPQLGLKQERNNPDKFSSDNTSSTRSGRRPTFRSHLTCFTPTVAHAQDTKMVQLVLSDIPKGKPATDAFKEMLNLLEELLSDETLGELTGYTLTYQAVVPEPANQEQTFSDMLASLKPLKLEELITSAKRPHLPANRTPLAESFVLGEKGQVWLINIPNFKTPTLGNQLEKGTVYLALSLRQANNDMVNKVIWRQKADLFMPDLITHKGYHQIRQYRLYAEQEQIGQTIQQAQTQKGEVERPRSKINLKKLPILIAQMEILRISLKRQIYNYNLWAEQVGGGQVIEYHAKQLQTTHEELESMIKEGKQALKLIELIQRTQ